MNEVWKQIMAAIVEELGKLYVITNVETKISLLDVDKEQKNLLSVWLKFDLQLKLEGKK